MELKGFQTRALETLGAFLGDVRVTGDLQTAFGAHAPKVRGEEAKYVRASGLEDVPYVCLRLPTGGGKTIVGAHAISTVAKTYLERELPFVLWMVPTDVIRRQTADALKNTLHPYRIALDEVFGGKVRVFDADEIDNLRPVDVRLNVCIVVTTIQTFRVADTDQRNVYADKESLVDFFAGASGGSLDMKADGKRVKYSFANLMRLQRPVVLVDEAHNVRTKLAFETLSRLSPSCLVELTATPQTTGETPSNILVRVSAGELKEAEMIKLPIVLTVHAEGWKQTVSEALRTQRRLLALAAGELPEYVRPLLLIQAQNKDREANVQAVKDYLVEEGVNEGRIKIATGEQRDLDGIDLFDPTVKVDVVITVQALREGWDCSFAYVFCSVAEIGSATAVEQLLGRVLRMPYARRRRVPELNEAYAHVVSHEFKRTAEQLRDCLIKEMGFTADEAQGALVEAPKPGPNLFSSVIDVTRRPDFRGLAEDTVLAVRVRQESSGDWSVELRDEVTPELEERVIAEVPETKRPEAVAKIAIHNREVRNRLSQHVQRAPFPVPRMWVTVDGQQQLFSDEVVDDAAAIDLATLPADLEAFHYTPETQRFAIDFRLGQLDVRPMGQEQPELPLVHDRETESRLVAWLDGELQDKRDSSAAKRVWLSRVVRGLIAEREVPLARLFQGKFALARRLRERLDEARTVAAQAGYQQLLLQVEVKSENEFAFRYKRDRYFPNRLYVGFSFDKHFYPTVGEMNGPEVDCAVCIDSLPEVATWVRNVERDEVNSFWLQTETDKFYPDFVVALTDGRVLLVEYKGKLEVKEDSDEKQRLGELWEERSEGRGLFLMARERDLVGRNATEQIRRKIAQLAAS